MRNLFSSNYYKIILKILHIKYGKGLILNGCPLIFNRGGSTIELGDNVVINSSFLSNLIGLYSRTIIVTCVPTANIWIGNHVGMSGVTIYARNSITIGDNTCIGGNAKILDNDFHPMKFEERNKDIREAIRTRPIVIGKNCFIGCNSLILKGTELGEGCVVGAGAVVSGKFPANSVIAGNPARVIKTLEQ